MNPVTLTTLITRVRQRANLEGATAFVTDAEITDHLNVSLANEVYDLVSQATGDNYYRRTFTFQTVNNLFVYDLPSDFYRIKSVDIQLGPNQAIPGRRFMEEERLVMQQYGPLGWSLYTTTLYTLYASQIKFIPTPGASFTIVLNYVPTSPQLYNTQDTWDDVNGWSELAVLDAAAKCALKQRAFDLVQALDMKKDRLAQKVRGLIPMRHEGEPERTHMFQRGNWGDGWDNGNWGY